MTRNHGELHTMTFSLDPIGHIRSEIKDRSAAPKQGGEGAPDAWLEVETWSDE